METRVSTTLNRVGDNRNGQALKNISNNMGRKPMKESSLNLGGSNLKENLRLDILSDMMSIPTTKGNVTTVKSTHDNERSLNVVGPRDPAMGP